MSETGAPKKVFLVLGNPPKICEATLLFMSDLGVGVVRVDGSRGIKDTIVYNSSAFYKREEAEERARDLTKQYENLLIQSS